MKARIVIKQKYGQKGRVLIFTKRISLTVLSELLISFLIISKNSASFYSSSHTNLSKEENINHLGGYTTFDRVMIHS